MKGKYISIRKSLNKKRLAERIYKCQYYNNLHQYSKNKIHCSCPLCSEKTSRNGYKISEQKRIDACKNQIFDFSKNL